MKTHDRIIRTAITSLLAAGALSLAAGALANDHSGEEKCAGVVKGGKNDCATSRNACHGHVKEDRNAEAWIYVPKGTCEKIVGARITAQIDPTPGVKN